MSLGYGMGAGKFTDRAKTYGLRLTLPESQKMVDHWRQTNDKIVEYWCARRAARQAGAADRHGRPVPGSKARNGQPLMTIMLPSGRRLYYRNIRLEPDPDRPGPRSHHL